jgi:hypothetical protein
VSGESASGGVTCSSGIITAPSLAIRPAPPHAAWGSGAEVGARVDDGVEDQTAENVSADACERRSAHVRGALLCEKEHSPIVTVFPKAPALCGEARVTGGRR